MLVQVWMRASWSASYAACAGCWRSKKACHTAGCAKDNSSKREKQDSLEKLFIYILNEFRISEGRRRSKMRSAMLHFITFARCMIHVESAEDLSFCDVKHLRVLAKDASRETRRPARTPILLAPRSSFHRQQGRA